MDEFIPLFSDNFIVITNNDSFLAQEIASVIDTLTKGSPQQQEDALNTYFLPNASFIHPFCRVPSFSQGAIPLARDLDSRWLILCIYRWYRTLSPRIDLTVDSAGTLSLAITAENEWRCTETSALLLTWSRSI